MLTSKREFRFTVIEKTGGYNRKVYSFLEKNMLSHLEKRSGLLYNNKNTIKITMGEI